MDTELLVGLLGLLGAVIAALLGAYATRYVGRAPKPVILVDHLEMTPSVRPTEEVVIPNEALAATLDADNELFRTLEAYSTAQFPILPFEHEEKKD